jgi:hypothetical protein
VVAFAFAGSFAASRLAESVGGGINGWVLPKPLQDFAKKYGAKVFEQKFSPKARNKKPSLITRREILVLAVSVLFTGFVMSFVGVNGYSNILDISKFTVAFGLALVSAFIIQAVSLLSDALCSYKAKPQKELKLWNLGTVMWFLSGIVAKVPFSSPSVSKSIGDAKYKVKQQKKIASLNVVVKVLAVLSLLLLFASLNAFGVLPEVGNYGLVTVMISFTAMVTPIAPLSGKDIYRYKKKTSLALVAFSILLLFLQFENTLTFWSYTIIGLAALALLPWAVWRLWSEKTRINQSYVSLWFEH